MTKAKSARSSKTCRGTSRAKRQETRAQRNIRWIEKHCKIPEGKFVGKPVRLRQWQKDILVRIYDNPTGTRTAIISFGKKNAKTTFSAFLLLLHLCGPESVPNTQLPSTAQSKEQAAVLFKLAAKIVRMSPTLSPPLLVVRDTVKEIYCPARGTLYKALSAEASTAHGQSPIFAVHDELGQVKGPVSELYNAIENAMGAHEEPLSVVISTQAATDADLLSVLIDDAQASRDPRIVVILYTADVALDPFSDEAIRQANPAFGDFLNADELRDQAKKAQRMRSLEPLYRNYTLNQRVEMRSPFISRSLWMDCAGERNPDFSGRAVYGGLDLSSVSDLTALILIAQMDDGGWHAKSRFWLPANGLAEKARHDRVPYDVWAREGFLQPVPGSSVDYDYVAEEISGLFADLDVRAIAFDRWNWKHFKPAMERQGFGEDDLAKFVEFGQGFQSMSPALRDLESLILNGRFRHDCNPVLTMCAANAVVQTDTAENRKLTKAKSHGRIDGMVALAMAVGSAPLAAPRAEKSFWETVGA